MAGSGIPPYISPAWLSVFGVFLAKNCRLPPAAGAEPAGRASPASGASAAAVSAGISKEDKAKFSGVFRAAWGTFSVTGRAAVTAAAARWRAMLTQMAVAVLDGSPARRQASPNSVKSVLGAAGASVFTAGISACHPCWRA